jgi:hypothetical protein
VNQSLSSKAILGRLLLPVAFLLLCGAEGLAKPADAGDDLFYQGYVPSLTIEMPESAIEILRSYQWDKSLNGQDRLNVLATVREGANVYTNVAVHLKGGLGSFRPVDDKPGLTLAFDKNVSGQRFHGLSKIYLNNSVQDPSYLSEKICREMFLAAGIPSPRTGHAVVTLNQRKLGLYVLVEGWNKQFLRRHFQDVRGNLYDGGYGNDVTNRLEINSGDFDGDWSHLQALGRAAEEPDVNQRLARMGEVLDLDRFITFMGMEIMLGHWDGYSLNKNNFRIFDDRATGRLVFLPHGMDQMFGVFRSTPTSSVTPFMKSLVSRAVIETPEGRRRYLERMSQLLTNVFKVDVLTNRIEQMAREVRPVLAGNSPGLPSFNSAVADLTRRMVQRAQSVTQQLQHPMPPLAFNQAGEAKLSGWRPQHDSGGPFFAKSLRNGQHVLVISASGGASYGSWRTTVLLDPGEYEFTGKAKLQGLETGQGVTRGGVTLRMSGERAAKMVTDAADWKTLTYNFKLGALAEVELVCEFRGSNGRVNFEADSLKLVRKSVPLQTSASSSSSQ